MALRLERRTAEAAVVVGVAGEVDNFTAPQLRAALLEARDSGAPRLIVDLTETDFLDSSALGTLVGVAKHLTGGTRLVLVCPRPHLRKVLRISRLDEVIDVYDSLADIPA
ncbi:STAS domain-containing protein [uncultured Jatrophihabitans sp.]|uniref:STAS domain-containing protein n=1 Tax=uncultured Jatrophihabitans sp. TaxID=1610747 RepID=UPI0035CBF97C